MRWKRKADTSERPTTSPTGARYYAKKFNHMKTSEQIFEGVLNAITALRDVERFFLAAGSEQTAKRAADLTMAVYNFWLEETPDSTPEIF